MDGSRFDALVRNLSAKRVSRLDALRGLAATAAAAVAGVALFSHESEAKNNGPKSNPKGKKKTICHCGTFDPSSCITLKPRPKSAKKHLKHQCDYAGPCVAGKVGCPIPSGGGPQPSVSCTTNGDCLDASAPCCNTLASGVKECGSCPPDTCLAVPCTEDAACNSAITGCTCRNIINGEGTCGTEDVCNPYECTENSDCNAAFDGCRCRNQDQEGGGTCGTEDICSAHDCQGDDDCNGDVKGCKCRDIDSYSSYGTCSTDDICRANKCAGDYDCNGDVYGCTCRHIDEYGFGTCGAGKEKE
jgi:hypothetical protein